MICEVGGALLLAAGAARIREGTTGWCALTGFYAIVFGFLMVVTPSIPLNDNGMPQVPMPQPSRHVECMQDCQAGTNDDE